MFVSHILKAKGRDTVTTKPEATIADIASKLKHERIGAVVVLDDDGAVKGIISERDIVHGLTKHGAALLAMPVSALMTRKVVTCAPDQDLDEIRKEMTSHRIRHLPVLEGGTMVGIISIGDVVKSRIEELKTESVMLINYITGKR